MTDDPADTPTGPEALKFILQETRVTLLQQILAHETGALSAEELIYRNPDLTAENVRYHLRELESRGIVEGLEIPPGERQRDFPNTFFAVTDLGVRLLKQANLFEEIELWAEMYDALERTERIQQIEQLDHRPRADQSSYPPTDDERSISSSTVAEDDPVVLIVDDEAAIVEMFASQLSERYSVRTATSGDAALDKIDSDVDVVLLDRRMPEHSGDEVLEAFRNRGHDCRVALVTAVEPDLDVLEMDFDDYLVKPVARNELLETVERLLNRADLDETMEAVFRERAKLEALEAAVDAETLESSPEYKAVKHRLASIQSDLDSLFDDLEVETDDLAAAEDQHS